MTQLTFEQDLLFRDGTSQTQRKSPALEPDYVAVDERSTSDLLAFIRATSERLAYFDEKNKAVGNWGAFLTGNLDEMAAYLEDPARFQSEPAKQRDFSRPHLVLLLAFLELLKHPQAQLNGLTGRHLEFYYREVLRLTQEPAVPDKVHVLIELVADQEQFRLPAGTLLSAGQDSQGADLFYRTDHEIVANQARVESLKSVFAQKRQIGIADVREDPRLLDKYASRRPESWYKPWLSLSSADRAFMGMVILALGGDSGLPAYPENRTVDAALLASLDGLLSFIKNTLGMPAAAFRSLMLLKEKLDSATADDETLDDWRRVYDILRAAGRRKGQPLTPTNLRVEDANRFATLVNNTLGPIDFSSVSSLVASSFDECYREVRRLESYFHMAAEDFVFVREIHSRDKSAVKPWEWRRVDEIFEQASENRELAEVLPARYQALREKRESGGFEALIRFALGHPVPGDELPEEKEFMSLLADRDQEYIREELYLEVASFNFIKGIRERDLSGTDSPDDGDWNTVYSMLERAQRRMRGWEEASKPEIERWDNLYASQDATAVQVASREEHEPQAVRWRTFGAAPSAGSQLPDGRSTADPPASAPATLGLAIASPLLALAEGKRTIVVTLGFGKDSFDEAAIQEALRRPIPFRFSLSSAHGMVPIAERPAIGDQRASVTIETVQLQPGRSDKPGLKITLHLDEQAPPVAPLATDWRIQTELPLLEITLKDIAEHDRVAKRYRVFQSLLLQHVHLAVEVSGLTELAVQSDDSVLDSSRPYQPFGFSPRVGSSFYFAHRELSSKQLDELSMELTWHAAPDNLHQHYLGYTKHGQPVDPNASPIADNTVFTADLRFHDNRAAVQVDEVRLFHADGSSNQQGAAKTHRLSVAAPRISRRDDTPPPTAENEALDWSRYWQLELTNIDLQHGEYPQAAARAAAAVDADGQRSPLVINPPYTPELKRFAIGYQASKEIRLRHDGGDAEDQVFHLEPFGYRPVISDAASSGNAPHLLPQYNDEGQLYIGISQMSAPQHLSLLFQVAEGSADPDVDREEVRWSYLSGNRWLSLNEGGVRKDTTNGLQTAGIIHFDLPRAAPSTRMPGGLYWLRAAIANHSRSVGDMVAVRAQAVSATFQDHDNAPDHLDRALPAGNITALADSEPAVAAVEQPDSSVSGRGAEQADHFNTRVSERLRHKNRALTCWDYERIVLEAFPEIYKVKCLPAGVAEDPRLADCIQVIVIPDIRGKLPFDPFEPKASAETLSKIEQYLRARAPESARLLVKNPRFIQLKVRFAVRLREGNDPRYYRPVLEDELRRFLAPWAYDESAEIVLGNKITANLIVDFVDRREYVDYLAGMRLFTSHDGKDFTVVTEETLTLPPDAVLTSARNHAIDLISDRYEEAHFVGINFMEVELDFQLRKE